MYAVSCILVVDIVKAQAKATDCATIVLQGRSDLLISRRRSPPSPPRGTSKLSSEIVTLSLASPLTTGKLHQDFGITVGGVNFLDLDSSTPKKFSRHLILHLPGDQVCCLLFFFRRRHCRSHHLRLHRIRATRRKVGIVQASVSFQAPHCC